MDDTALPTDPLAILPPLLAARVRRLARLWDLDLPRTLEQVLERGLFECEAELRARFTPTETDAWRAAIVALQRQPDDPGFALIGRVPAAGPSTAGDALAEPAVSPAEGAPGGRQAG